MGSDPLFTGSSRIVLGVSLTASTSQLNTSHTLALVSLTGTDTQPKLVCTPEHVCAFCVQPVKPLFDVRTSVWSGLCHWGFFAACECLCVEAYGVYMCHLWVHSPTNKLCDIVMAMATPSCSVQNPVMCLFSSEQQEVLLVLKTKERMYL